MMFVKLPRGSSRWTLIEAEQVDTDGLWYQLPTPPEPGPDEVAGLDIPAELRKRDVELRERVCVLDVSALFAKGKPWHDNVVKIVHVLDRNTENGGWWTYVFQGTGYVMSESGGTIEKL